MVKKVTHKKTKTIKVAAIIILAVAAFGAAFVILKVNNVIFRKAVVSSTDTVTGGTMTKGESSSNNNTGSTNNNGVKSGDAKGNAPIDKNGDAPVQPTVDLISPSGTFVSNHHVNLSDPQQLNVQSNCTTTPGAYCSIHFINGSVNKALPSILTDAGGAAYWSWNVKNFGLTAGTWQVVAIASSGNSTMSTTDALNLEITQ